VTTILFTDLVGSTQLMQRVGDEAAQRIFQSHHWFLRDSVQAAGGEVIEWTGDGVMAVFTSSSDAVRCAISVQESAPREGSGETLEVRMGLNVGEVLRQETGSGYFGTPLVVARRLCDLAAPGQVLCTATVAALLAGRRAFRFKDLGTQTLKGITEPVRVSEVLCEARRPMGIRPGALERLIGELPLIVVATDARGMITYVNRGASEVLGYEPEEIFGHYVAQLYPTPEEARRVMSAVREPERDGRGRLVDFPTTYRCKGGREVAVAMSGVVFYDENGEEAGTIGLSRLSGGEK
jgi:PAS domain S-box-containing protein